MSNNHKVMKEKFTTAADEFMAILDSIDADTMWTDDPPEWWLALDRIRLEIYRYRRTVRSTP